MPPIRTSINIKLAVERDKVNISPTGSYVDGIANSVLSLDLDLSVLYWFQGVVGKRWYLDRSDIIYWKDCLDRVERSLGSLVCALLRSN